MQAGRKWIWNTDSNVEHKQFEFPTYKTDQFGLCNNP